jgi:hypothetical protein
MAPFMGVADGYGDSLAAAYVFTNDAFASTKTNAAPGRISICGFTAPTTATT